MLCVQVSLIVYYMHERSKNRLVSVYFIWCFHVRTTFLLTVFLLFNNEVVDNEFRILLLFSNQFSYLRGKYPLKMWKTGISPFSLKIQ